jgi:hypothetical protein
MAVNSVSPGSYNSPSVQPQAQTKPTPPEKRTEPKREEAHKSPENNGPTVNTSGQTVGTIVNTKA